jgi:hypothetical protein
MRIRHAGKIWDVYLEDDGTLDTVISIDGTRIRFDMESAAEYRDEDTGEMTAKGLRALAVSAIDGGDMDDAMEMAQDNEYEL